MRLNLVAIVAAIIMISIQLPNAPDRLPAPRNVAADVEFVAWITGPESANMRDSRYDIDGTDLGIMFVLNETLYLAFGDTYGCCRPLGGGAGGGNWRSNTLAYTTDRNLDDGINFDHMISDMNGVARTVLQKRQGDHTLIPTYGVSVADRLYLHYMAVRSWDSPGQWTLNRSGWAYSDDQGQTWTQPDNSVWQGDTNFGQAAVVRMENYLYIFGIHGGRFGGVALARVPEDAVTDMHAYQYWSGSTWSDKLSDAVEVASAPVGELSVAWNDFLGQWIMTYLDVALRAIVMRQSPTLNGPWSEPNVLVSSRDYPMLYGGYLHPWASSGETIYFNMSQWEPYNVRLMRAHLKPS